MRLASLPCYKICWSIYPIYKSYFFQNVICRERFELIMNFFHFDDQPKFDPLGKIKMINDNFNDVMLQMIKLLIKICP